MSRCSTSRMRYQGTGFFNRRSKITVRLVSRERGETIDRGNTATLVQGWKDLGLIDGDGQYKQKQAEDVAAYKDGVQSEFVQYQIDMARFAIGTVNGDVHIASAGIGRVEFHRIAKGLDGNIRQALFGAELDVVALEQAAILIDGTFLRCDGDGRARPALAGLDSAGQGDPGLLVTLMAELPF